MSHDLTPEQVDAIVERTLLQRKKQYAYMKANWVQINLRFRIGSDYLDALDQARGNLSRHAYALRVLKHHLTIVNPTLDPFES